LGRLEVRRDGSMLAAELAGVFEADGVRAAVAGLLSGARRACAPPWQATEGTGALHGP